MTEPHVGQPRGRRRHAYHLIWALPLALIISNIPLFMSVLIWCGISGCSGGGFGRVPDPDVAAAVSWLIAAGVIAAIPFAVVPWTRNVLLRVSATVFYAAVVTVVSMKNMWS